MNILPRIALLDNMLTEQQSRLNLNCNSFGTGLSLLHMNIRSISNKFDKITNFLGQLKVKFPIVGISETWLVDCCHFVKIVGYNFLHKPRVNRIGGGVGIYIGEHLNYKERPDLAFCDNECAESLFVEINRSNEKNVIVGIVYRPPDSKLNEFLCDFDLLVEKISKENKLVFLMGDWNLNLIRHHCHKATSEFLDTLFSRLFFPLITRPTRITAHKASLIDNIFTNDPFRPSISGLFLNDISDHLPIFSLILILDNDSIGVKDKYITFREKNAHNLISFKEELAKIKWTEMPGLNDPSRAYEIFAKKYISIYDRCFPLKKMKAERLKLRKPWFTKGLAKSVKKKNMLYKRFLNNPSSFNENAYKSFKNKLTHSLRVAKRLYTIMKKRLIN